MTESGPQTQMLQMVVDPMKVVELGIIHDRRLGNDEGYLIHGLLRSLFGDKAPRLFALGDVRGGRRTVLGYGEWDAETLHGVAEAGAEPLAYGAVNWDAFATKPMPRRWPDGGRLPFEVRACPVQRMAAAGPRHRKGAEVDVFLARCWAAGDPSVSVDRYEVYRDWLTTQLETRGAVSVVRVDVDGYQRVRMSRRAHGNGRNARVVERPSVLFRGEIELTPGHRLSDLLSRGVGRHRAFGFGMPLFRPIGS